MPSEFTSSHGSSNHTRYTDAKMTIISYKSQFIFVHIPKCAGTSIETEWERTGLEWGEYVVGSTRHGEVLHRIFSDLYGLHKHNTAVELQQIVGPAQWPRFEVCAIVRQPRAIVSSHYKFAFSVFNFMTNETMKARNYNQSMLPKVRQMILDDLMATGRSRLPERHVLQMAKGALLDALFVNSFEEFLERVLDDRWLGYNQKYICDADGNRIVSTVLKLEEPATVVDYFRRVRGPQFELRSENKGLQMATPWSTANLKKLYEICGADYDYFNYPMEL